MDNISADTNQDSRRQNFDMKQGWSVDWQETLVELNALDIEVIEFVPKLFQNDHWTLDIEHKSEAKNKSQENIDLFDIRLNASLKRAFTEFGKLDSKYWKNNFEKLREGSFYIPKEDLHRVNSVLIKNHLCYYKLLLQKFKYHNFFLDLQDRLKSLESSGHTAPRVAWYYLKYYCKFLRQLKLESEDLYQAYGKWFSEFLDLGNFHKRLPSEQVTILLLGKCEAVVAGINDQWEAAQYYSQGTSEVISFFRQYDLVLESYFGDSIKEFDTKNLRELYVSMEEAYLGIFLSDYDDLYLQEILDNKSNLKLTGSLSLFLQLKYGPKSFSNVKGVVKDSFFIGKERPAGEFKEDDKELPKYRCPKQIVYPNNVQYWYDILPREKKTILDQIESKASKTLLEAGAAATKMRCQAHWTNLINLITAPTFIWRYDNNDLYPQMNVLNGEEARYIRDLAKSKEKEWEKERLLLEFHIKEISKFDFIEDLETYLMNHSPVITNDDLHKRWTNEIRNKMKRLEQRESFIQSRMREFGFDESGLGKDQKRLLLKEIFKIEEEVKPYITYVKKAFQTALPIRKRVLFSEYRHGNDGVEFDSDTLYDQEKWIRADVMKILESKTEKGEAIQINTFCLDFSGSMNHDRMRNLFKILYLLVLGLEDRKSYDAFHFFSNNFIPVADFSNDFTTRKVLLTIMQQITSTNLGWVNYYGAGGTNMSEGIDLCHKRMKDFVTEFRKTNPETNIVSSIL